MLTSSMFTRLWRTARYRHLIRRLVEGRPEAALDLDKRIGGPTAAAALGLLWLGELNRARQPVAVEMRERLLMGQGRDGSWGDTSSEKAMLTAICVRGLAASPQAPAIVWLGMNIPTDREAASPQEAAVARGVRYLAASFDAEGGWAGDAFATGFVLLELGRMEGFRRSVPVDQVARLGRAWPPTASAEEVRLVWSLARRRCGAGITTAPRRPDRREPLIFAEVA